MTSRTPHPDDHHGSLPVVRLVSDDPAILALEQSLDQLAKRDRAQLSPQSMERMVEQVTQVAAMQRGARVSASSPREVTTLPPSRRMPMAMAAMLALGAMGAAAALLGQRAPVQAPEPRMAHRDRAPAATAALPTDAEWDLVDAVLTLANTTSDTPSDVWNDAQTLQQQWSEGTWLDEHAADSAS